MTEAATVSESTEKADIGALLDAMSPEERKGIQGRRYRREREEVRKKGEERKGKEMKEKERKVK